ncbi:NAD-dependent epimerase/dehydratase family protein [Arthrobacter oryzae]|uniref:NAD-dependent epimerase/dehydratase family protein n=1 Tax=Arthrobacter oryzae TaxID=409290 RepID=UPI00286526DF|nr:NAD-dependent epimerase/dehydratase family protein [Arthrobacter oryzae]MDR6508794.1 nucleoside-diphosphate-sugar epimerase [Arthrobacter oryzae]
MRILILGGTAFLSAEIARQALAAGHTVTCLARGSAATPPDGTVWLKADRTQGMQAYEEAAGNWDAVIDVTRDPEQARDALELLAPAAAHWTTVSSCSVYADHSVPGEDESAALLPPLAPGIAFAPENYGEAKSAIEQRAVALAGTKAHLCRAGLIGGPGDGTDRYGYWPARYSRGAGPVLVPDIGGSATQIIDVRDLAAWILKAAALKITGPLNAVGSVVPFRDYLDESMRLAGYDGRSITVSEDWLVARGIAYWAGKDSLPLWLPPGHDGFAARSNAAAIAAGLTFRPWQETLRDTLDDERGRGLDRARKAGLSEETEKRLVAEFQAAGTSS